MAEPLEMVEGTETPTGEEVQPQDETGTEIPGETEVEGAEPSGDDPTAAPPKKGVQERIDQITREKHEAREEAIYWRGIAEGRAGRNVPPEPEAAKPVGAPRGEDFDTDEAYQDARLEYAAEQGAIKGATSAKREFQEERQKEVAVQKADRLKEAIGGELFARVKKEGAFATDEMLDAAGEQKPKFVEYLLDHPDESQRISALSDTQRGIATERILVGLRKPEGKKTTSAPNPPATVGGGGSPPKKTMENMSQEERFAAWTKKERQKRGLEP